MRYLYLFLIMLFCGNIYAADLDSTSRTERYGLSFYNGEPLYIASIPTDRNLFNGVHNNITVHRVKTGESIYDYGLSATSNYMLVRVPISQSSPGVYYLYATSSWTSYDPLPASQVRAIESAIERATLSSADAYMDSFDGYQSMIMEYCKYGLIIGLMLFVITYSWSSFMSIIAPSPLRKTTQFGNDLDKIKDTSPYNGRLRRALLREKQRHEDYMSGIRRKDLKLKYGVTLNHVDDNTLLYLNELDKYTDEQKKRILYELDQDFTKFFRRKNYKEYFDKQTVYTAAEPPVYTVMERPKDYVMPEEDDIEDEEAIA